MQLPIVIVPRRIPDSGQIIQLQILPDFALVIITALTNPPPVQMFRFRTSGSTDIMQFASEAILSFVIHGISLVAPFPPVVEPFLRRIGRIIAGTDNIFFRIPCVRIEVEGGIPDWAFVCYIFKQTKGAM